MIISMLKSKIHRATVTEANLDYIGSITIDENLMEAAGLIEYECVQVLNITNGNRLETYVIKGPIGSNSICINGAAAHLVHKNDLVIIASYCQLNINDVNQHKPKIIQVNNKNQIITLSKAKLSSSV